MSDLGDVYVLGNAALSEEYGKMLDGISGYRQAMEADDLGRWRHNLRLLEIDLASALKRMDVRFPVQFEPWPDGTPSAFTQPTAHGYLVLINFGLVELATSISRIYTLLTLSQGSAAQKHTTEMIRTVYTGGSLRKLAERIPVPEGRRTMAGLLSGMAVRFVVCHELAHCQLGHIEEVLATAPLDPADPWSLANRELHNQLREYKADELAEELLRTLHPGDRPGEAKTVIPARGLGPLLLLSALSWVQWLWWDAGRFDVGGGHPPLDVRLYAWLETLRARYPEFVRNAAERYLEEWHYLFAGPLPAD